MVDDVFSPHLYFPLLNMAENSAKVANMARILTIVHIIVGFLLVCFGIADRVVEYFFTGYGCYGIWIGVWVSLACAYIHYSCSLYLYFENRVDV